MISVDNFNNGIILTVLGLLIAFLLLVSLAFSVFIISKIMILSNVGTKYFSKFNRSKDEAHYNKSLAAAVAVTILKNNRISRSEISEK